MTRHDLPFYSLRVFLFSPVKRIIDVFCSIIFLIIFSPILFIVSILIKITSSGPVIFKQKRVGKNSEFDMYKFRSMRVGDNDKYLKDNFPKLWEKYKANDWKLSASEDPRITPIGKFIRATSIDEMPQFINVLKGNMSLVGPRAYRDQELKEYSKKYPETIEYIKIIRTAKPGITGLWQVSGRNDLPFEKRAKMDADYIKNRSLRQEIAIIFKTPMAMFSHW